MNLRLRLLLPVAVAATALVPLAQPAAAAEPPRIWQRDIPGALLRESSPALADVDRNGTLDVLVGGHDRKLHVVSGTTGTPLPNWPQETTHRIDSSPSVGDVDGDGRPEIFVGSGQDGDRQGALYSYDLDGRVRFRRILPDPDFPNGAPVRTAAALGDIDRDGNIDATVGSLGVRSLWSFRGSDGAALTGDELFYWDDSMFATPALADVDGNGTLDAVAAGDSSPGAPIDHRGGMVRAVTGDGRVLWTFHTNEMVRSSPAIGDIDGDGRLEVVFGAGDFWHGSDATKVFAIDAATGSLKWARETDGVTNSSPALADIDGDGRLDVAIGTFNSQTPPRAGGSVYALNGTDGGNLRGFPKASGGGVVLGGIVTADVDGDGGQDLFVPTGAYIAVFSGKTGAKLFNLAEGAGVGFQNSVAIADVDANGKLDVIAAGTAGSTGRIYRWELPAPARLGNLGWHQFHKDAHRTGSWTSTMPNAGTIPFSRLSGTDRFSTAVALSAGAPTGGTVYVATGTAFADALAGGPAAASQKGPMLLVTRDDLPAPTRQRLTELKPQRIVVLGGPAAVSDAVLGELQPLATDGATRVAGTNRYGTAAAVSARVFTTPGVPVAYVATGASFPDALAGAAAGALRGGPVLLVERDGIPEQTAAELRRLSPRSIVILGGTGAVSGGVESALRSYSSSVTRAAGPDRYSSAVEVSKATFPNGAATAYLATGTNFPDALAGGPVAAAANAPLLLVRGACLPNVVRAELTRLGATKVVLLGGEGAVSSAVAALTPCS